MESYRETLASLNPTEARQALEKLRERVRTLFIHYLSGKMDKIAGEKILDQINQWSENVISRGLPLQVQVVKIYPEEMPLSTLQFTERLGYRKENAIKMLAMGCYDTLNALRRHLEALKALDMDAQDLSVLALVRKWMGNKPWPGSTAEQENFCREWRCQRETCAFYSGFCLRGVLQSKS